MVETSRDLTTVSIQKGVLSMAGPMVIGMAALASLEVVDIFFLGQLGTAEVAAVGFCGPVMFFGTGITAGLSSAVQSIVSRATGSQDTARTRRIVTHAIALAIFMCILMIAGGFVFMDPIFSLLGATADVMPLIRQYISIWFFALFFYVVPFTAGAALMASGDARSPMFFMLGGAVLNVVLDPLLIFGLGPFPAMGITGAALATAIARFLIAICAAVLVIRRGLICVPDAIFFKQTFEIWRQLFRIGVPVAGTELIQPMVWGVLIRLLSAFGAAGVAGFAMGSRIGAMVGLVSTSLAFGLLSVIGQNWGAGLFDRVKSALRFSERIALGWGISMWVLFAVGSTYIATTFVDEPETVEALTLYLLIVPISYGLSGVFAVGHSCLTAIDEPYIASILAAARSLLVIAPFAWIGGHFFGLVGIFASLPIANLLAATVTGFVARRRVDRGPSTGAPSKTGENVSV